jgi:hypothetical protein
MNYIKISMFKAIVALVISMTPLFFTSKLYSQKPNSGEWAEFGLDISSNPAIGFNIGYINYDKPMGELNYFSGYFIGFDGLIGRGKDYSDIITLGMYPNDVKEEGYYYEHFGIRVGVSTSNTITPYALLGYTVATYIQNRNDRLNILSNNGDYYIGIADSDKSSFDFGVGLKLSPPSYNSSRLTLGFELSKNRGVSIVLNYSMFNNNIW